METLIVFRHGESELNLRSDLTGEEAERSFAKGLPANIDLTAGLTPDGGMEHARHLQGTLASVAIDRCFTSPYRRAIQTATIGLEHHMTPDQFIHRDGLVERDRGLFKFLPDGIGRRLRKEHPEYWENPHSTIHRRPKDGETLYEVMHRLTPVLAEADALTNGTVAFSTHAETMIAIRALVGRFDDDRLAAPLIPNPPEDIPALQRSNWNGYCQADFYTKRNPHTGETAPYMTHLKSVGIYPRPYSTGWITLPEE